VQRILGTHLFGAHRVVVLEHVEDDGLAYSLAVDGKLVTEPAPAPPTFEELVRLYARSRAEVEGERASDAGDGPARAQT
jgi:hypothetical protein